jgi:hypothetical protein
VRIVTLSAKLVGWTFLSGWKKTGKNACPTVENWSGYFDTEPRDYGRLLGRLSTGLSMLSLLAAYILSGFGLPAGGCFLAILAVLSTSFVDLANFG